MLQFGLTIISSDGILSDLERNKIIKAKVRLNFWSDVSESLQKCVDLGARTLTTRSM